MQTIHEVLDKLHEKPGNFGAKHGHIFPRWPCHFRRMAKIPQTMAFWPEDWTYLGPISISKITEF